MVRSGGLSRTAKSGYAVSVTERLYYADNSLLEFDASILKYGPRGPLHEVVLDRTCFFPGSGGQPADTGTLGGARVTCLEERDGDIVHVVDAPLADGPVHGVVDGARRRDFMAQHTGEHVLAQALLRAGNLPTVSVHFGDETTTIELSAPVVPDDVIARAEEIANTAIMENRKVLIHEADPSEASRFPLRRKPPEVGRLRVVEIEGYDWVGCSGVHVSSTGQLLLIKVISQEKIRGHARLHVLIGQRALADYGRKVALAQALSRALTCGEEHIQARVEELLKDAREKERELKKARAVQAVAAAREAVSQGKQAGRALVVRGESDGAGAEYLKAFADEAISAPGRAVIVVDRSENGFQWIAAHSLGADVDLAAIVKPLLQSAGAKGGGRAAWVQGSGADREAATGFAAAVADALTRTLG